MLQKLSVRYDPVEDRMVVHLHVVDGTGQTAEHVLHITRRVCAAWRADLQAMVDLSAQAPEKLDMAARAAVSKAHHDAMSSQATVRTEPAPTEDAGEAETTAPLLVTKVVCGRRRADGRWVIRFDTKTLPPLGLVLSSQTLHALVDALSRRLQTANWALGALPSEQQTATPTALAQHMH